LPDYRKEGQHIFGSGLCKDTGCPLHESCLTCTEPLPCPDDDTRLSHRQWLWLRYMATLVRVGGHDKRNPELYQKALTALRKFAICLSKAERKRIREVKRNANLRALLHSSTSKGWSGPEGLGHSSTVLCMPEMPAAGKARGEGSCLAPRWLLFRR
jgi:hypothetical protein